MTEREGVGRLMESELTRASARADSASCDCRNIFSVMSGLMGGREEGRGGTVRSGVAP